MSTPDASAHAEISAEDLRELVKETKELRETLQQRYVTRERYRNQFLTTVTVTVIAIILLGLGIWRVNGLSEQRHQDVTQRATAVCKAQQKDRADLVKLVDQSEAPSASLAIPAGTPTWFVQILHESQASGAAFQARVHEELPPINCRG